MRRVIVLLALLFAFRADAHVGSPDVFFEGNAGPYNLFVTVRTPQVIPGIADIEIRSESPDVSAVTVVPLRLTGPGSELPPAPDTADRSRVDPQFYTAQLWLMEHGSLQVRITVTGARGTGTLAVPVPALARATLHMSTGLGVLLAILMLVLAISIVAILAGAAREATLEPGELPAPTARRRTTIAAVVVGAIVIALVALGNLWWNDEASTYLNWVQTPWAEQTPRDRCTLRIAHQNWQDDVLLRDHGHLKHLFVVSDIRDRIAHLHAEPEGPEFAQRQPSLPAVRYHLYADVVFSSGFPITGTATLDLPDLHCDALTGDDSTWSGPTATGDLAGGAKLVFDRPAHLRAKEATPLHFHVVDANGNPAQLEPYMGMTAHAAIIGDGVFAHLHPSGSVAMPALELAQTSGMPSTMHMAPDMPMPMPAITPDFQFPYGFPKPGDYRIFVQIKRAGAVETGVFDVHVD